MCCVERERETADICSATVVVGISRKRAFKKLTEEFFTS